MTTEFAENQRRQATLEALRADGINPFPDVPQGPRSLISDVLSRPRSESRLHHLYGRVIGRRKLRSGTLLKLEDRTGTLPVFIHDSKDGLTCELGDIVALSGHVAVKREPAVLQVESGMLLAKAFRRPPAAGHLGEGHARNRRELELLAYPARRSVFMARSEMLAGLREGLADAEFIEVETPMLQTLPGGAVARPFVTYHNTLRRRVSLRIATELFLQRCIVGGFERVYELGKCFRNEGISHRHSPEFTMLEWSMAYCDYGAAARFIESLIARAVERMLGGSDTIYNGERISFRTPWRHMTLQEAICERTGLDIRRSSSSELVAAMPGEAQHGLSWSDAVLAVYAQCVEPTLIQPTVVYDFPVETHPCVKRKSAQPEIGQSFDIVVGGVEICSGGSGLNDPEEQWERFVAQRADTGPEAEPQPNDRDYVAALEYGLPPVAGGGVGLDRLLMVILNQDSILDAVLFPATR